MICLLYAVLHFPLFFLYPNYNSPVKMNISEGFFHELSDSLNGDCYRISKNFERECPFPTREVHLNSEHTIVEIKINKKWYAYDPLFKTFFDNQNVTQISYDMSRSHTPNYLRNYMYKESFKNVYFYHHWYFILLKKISPWHNKLIRIYYDLGS